MDAWIVEGGLGALMAVLWYLLKQKDEQNKKDIALLWQKHDEDVKALAKLELSIAGDHYRRDELDRRFDKLEQTFAAGFDKFVAQMEAMSGELKQLRDSIIHHLAEKK